MIFVSPKIYVDNSPLHGRGVFANEFISKDEVIETCHFVLLQEKDYIKLDNGLKPITFSWPLFSKDSHAVVLGWGSIYNHKDDNNATWSTDVDNQLFKFFAIKDIQPGEEICTNYMKSTIF